MESLLQSDHFTLQSKIKWLPSLRTKFEIINAENQHVGSVHFHPVWMSPILWFFGLILELGMVGGGLMFIFQGENNVKFFGGALVAIGAFLMFAIQFRSFLSSRASSFVEIMDAEGQTILSARKGWALFKPNFTVKDELQNKTLGNSRQSFLWGDCAYTIWDETDQEWGSIQRRVWGFQYRIFKGKERVGRFRRKLLDARKMFTGLRSYTFEYENTELSLEERSLMLGTIIYVDVLTRQKELRSDKKETPPPTPTKKA